MWQVHRRDCKFGVVFERRKLRENVGMSKVLVCSWEEGGAELRVRLNGELLEEVESFKYLGSVISKDAGVRQIVSEGVATYGAMKSTVFGE